MYLSFSIKSINVLISNNFFRHFFYKKFSINSKQSTQDKHFTLQRKYLYVSNRKINTRNIASETSKKKDFKSISGRALSRQ